MSNVNMNLILLLIYCIPIQKAITKLFPTPQDLLHNTLGLGLDKIRERSTGLSKKKRRSC